MDLDVEAVERAEKSLDAFVNARSRDKKKANATAAQDRAAEQERREKRRRANLEGWIEYRGRLQKAHQSLADENGKERARLLLLKADYPPEDQDPGPEPPEEAA